MAADGTGGEEALRDALDEHGAELAAALSHTEQVEDLIETVILVVASADEEEVEHVTDSLVALANAVDGLATEESVALAEAIGERGDDAAAALETVLRLEREDELGNLVDLAGTLSALDLDEESVEGLNRLLDAVGEAERDHEPVGLLGGLRAARTPDVRAGLGYLLAVVRARGRRLRE